jgi:hypothetical protein
VRRGVSEWPAGGHKCSFFRQPDLQPMKITLSSVDPHSNQQNIIYLPLTHSS